MLLLIPIFMLSACSEMEEEYVPPHIVSIDPPIQEFTKEEMLELAEYNPLQEFPKAEAMRLAKYDAPWDPLPTRYIHLNRGEFATVTVTFSAPPEELDLNMSRWGVLKYSLNDSTLEATVYCITPLWHHSRRIWYLPTLKIEWKGGGQRVMFWCPSEEEE